MGNQSIWVSSQGPGRGAMGGLDNQQRQIFQEALQKDSDKLRSLEEKLAAAQKELLAVALDEKADDKALRGKAEAVAGIQVEITMLRAKALAIVGATMKDDQKKQLIDSPAGYALLGSGGAVGPIMNTGGNFQAVQAPGRVGMAGLDNQQRMLFQEALQKDGDKLRALEEKLAVAQTDLVTATVDSNYNETTVRGKAEAVGKIQIEMTMLRAKALASVASHMNADQKQQLAESPMGVALLSGGGGMGGAVFAFGAPGGFPGGGGFNPGGPGGFPGGPGGFQGSPGGFAPGNGGPADASGTGFPPVVRPPRER